MEKTTIKARLIFGGLGLTLILLTGLIIFFNIEKTDNNAPLNQGGLPNEASINRQSATQTDKAPVFGANIVRPASGSVNIGQIQASGTTATTYWVYMPRYMRNPLAVLREIDKLSKVKGNLTMYVHIMPQARPESPDERFHRPDMNEYLPALKQLAADLKGKVKYYSIGNEVPATWTDSLENYKILLAESKKAIKSVNPDAVILDSGTSSGSMGMIVANSLYRAGKVGEAITFVNGYYRLHSGPQLKGLVPVKSEADLKNLLGGSEAQKSITFGEALFTDFCPNYETLQLHFYQEWPYLPVVMSYVKEQMRLHHCVKPVQIWELGYGVDRPADYDLNAHAKAVPKYLAIAQAYGAEFINTVTFYDKPGFARGLYSSSGQMQSPGVAFQTTVTKLTGSVFIGDRGNGKDVWIYEYSKTNKTFYVAWSTVAGQVKIPLVGLKATARAIDGTTSTLNPQAVALTDSPIIIE
ncbi:hypothetical protein HY214_04895 [Candidatus Roizmanbacteria bacterium]|nr:hypothetical protein [Candidatus Roizmanbacteria bacterium]